MIFSNLNKLNDRNVFSQNENKYLLKKILNKGLVKIPQRDI